jgi:hypothetical protein
MLGYRRWEIELRGNASQLRGSSPWHVLEVVVLNVE